MKLLNNIDLIGGILMLLVGVFFLVGSFQYPFGTLQRMGSGLFPMGLSVIMVVLGLLVMAGALKSSEPLPPIAWRPMFATAAAIGVFAYGLSTFGLVPAVAATVVVAAFGDKGFRAADFLILIFPFTLLIYLVFIKGLGLPIPAIRM